MKISSSLLIYSAYAANTRDCANVAENEACGNRCADTFFRCARNCDGDQTCIGSCSRTQVDCEANCPCGNECPGGCPCPKATSFCNKCENEKCKGFAEGVLAKMDTSVNPCENFDQYVCGQWKEESEIPSDSGSFTQFTVVRKELSATLKRVLENTNETDGANSWDSVKKAKRFYKNCMDMDTINAMSNEQLQKEVNISWPSMGFANAGETPYVNIIQALGKYGQSVLFRADQDLDNDDSNKWIIDLGHPSLGMSQTYFTTENEADQKKYKDAYIGFIKSFSTYYNEQFFNLASVERIQTMAEKIYEFERQIAVNMWSKVENRDPANTTYKKPLSELTTNKIVSDWSQFLNDLFENLGVSGIDTTGSTIVNNSDRKWFAAVDKAIEAAEMSDADILDYIAWRIHQGVLSYLGDDWRATADEFNQVVSGTDEPERWRTCSDAANGAMEWPVGKLYIDEDFSVSAKAKCEEMIEELQEAFSTQILADADWMSAETKVKAKEKLDKMAINVAYPDWINDQASVDTRYETFEVQDGNYIGTRLSGRRWQNVEWWSLFKDGGVVDKEMWLTGPAIVNAFYSSNFNSITFPAGILQPPFFHEFRSTAMNFGGIGVVIGHEITHGFDDQGSKFDGEGNFNNWWAENDLANFNDRVQCIKDEYSGFFFNEAQMNLNGDLTAGENTADNGGLHESLYAFSNWQAKGNTDTHLPELSDQFTEEQLFFINYGQIWCAKYRPEYAVWMATNDPHSPGEFRTNGAVQNHPGFGRAFGCQVGKEPMSPEEYCRVW